MKRSDKDAKAVAHGIVKSQTDARREMKRAWTRTRLDVDHAATEPNIAPDAEPKQLLIPGLQTESRTYGPPIS